MTDHPAVLTRRSALVGLLAAPAIVRSIMPINSRGLAAMSPISAEGFGPAQLQGIVTISGTEVLKVEWVNDLKWVSLTPSQNQLEVAVSGPGSLEEANAKVTDYVGEMLKRFKSGRFPVADMLEQRVELARPAIVRSASLMSRLLRRRAPLFAWKGLDGVIRPDVTAPSLDALLAISQQAAMPHARPVMVEYDGAGVLHELRMPAAIEERVVA